MRVIKADIDSVHTRVQVVDMFGIHKTLKSPVYSRFKEVDMEPFCSRAILLELGAVFTTIKKTLSFHKYIW